MYAYREILTLDDPNTLTLSQSLPLPKGRRVEVLVLDRAEEEDGLGALRDAIAQRGIGEDDVREAIAWARRA